MDEDGGARQIEILEATLLLPRTFISIVLEIRWNWI
jgi:hypothetical protein